MERLMRDIDGYQRDSGTGYNTLYITKLVRNYRSHDDILNIPRKLFYDNELVKCGDPMILTSMLNWEHLPNKKFPLVFHSVLGIDEREADSPSFFNRWVLYTSSYTMHSFVSHKECLVFFLYHMCAHRPV